MLNTVTLVNQNEEKGDGKMPTVGTKVSDEQLEVIREYADQRNMNVSQLLLEAIDALFEGKITIKPRTPKISLMCPDCGMHLVYAPRGKEGPHLFCLRCGWWAPIKLPRDKWHRGEFEI